jgi:hypothetical protein
MRKTKARHITEDIARVLIDVGKLVLGSIALGGVLRGNVEQITLLLTGFTASALLIIGGLILLALVKEE